MMRMLIVLMTAQDFAAAGAAYRAGVEALERGRPEAAAERFRQALGRLDEETPSLYYRDREGRHRLAYHPRYMLARALLAQDPGPDAAREAIAHLEKSAHPDAERALLDARGRLDAGGTAENPVRAALRRWVEELCGRGRFEEALRAAEKDPSLADRIRVRRGEAVDLRARALADALKGAGALDPLRQAEATADLFRSAVVPPEVQAHPEPPLRWAQRFVALLDREAPRLREAATLPVDAALATAAAFDASAEEARAAGCPEGARAALRTAHATRLARLETATGNGAEALVLLEAAEASVRRALALGMPEGDVRSFADHVALRRAEALRAGTLRAEEAAAALRDPGRMADPGALSTAAARLAETSDARRQLQRALLDASRLFLQGEGDSAVAARVGPSIADALARDPSAADVFDGLSPRLQALRPQAK